MPPERFHIDQGSDLIQDYWSSAHVLWQFCQRCGSSLFYKHEDTPNQVYVTVASLDTLDRPVDGHASFEEHAPWLDLGENVPRYLGKTEERL